MHRPQTIEGRKVWDLALRLDGQMRVISGGGVVGWDMAAALALAKGLDFPIRAVEELLPRAEAGMARAINRKIREAMRDRQE